MLTPNLLIQSVIQEFESNKNIRLLFEIRDKKKDLEEKFLNEEFDSLEEYILILQKYDEVQIIKELKELVPRTKKILKVLKKIQEKNTVLNFNLDYLIPILDIVTSSSFQRKYFSILKKEKKILNKKNPNPCEYLILFQKEKLIMASLLEELVCLPDFPKFREDILRYEPMAYKLKQREGLSRIKNLSAIEIFSFSIVGLIANNFPILIPAYMTYPLFFKTNKNTYLIQSLNKYLGEFNSKFKTTKEEYNLILKFKKEFNISIIVHKKNIPKLNKLIEYLFYYFRRYKKTFIPLRYIHIDFSDSSSEKASFLDIKDSILNINFKKLKSPQALEETLDHELAHAIDYHLSLYKNIKVEWEKTQIISPKKANMFMRLFGKSSHSGVVLGFFSAYGTTNYKEDIAEFVAKVKNLYKFFEKNENPTQRKEFLLESVLNDTNSNKQIELITTYYSTYISKLDLLLKYGFISLNECKLTKLIFTSLKEYKDYNNEVLNYQLVA